MAQTITKRDAEHILSIVADLMSVATVTQEGKLRRDSVHHYLLSLAHSDGEKSAIEKVLKAAGRTA